MESDDSQDNIAGEGWIEFMLIFSVVLVVIGLVLGNTMSSSDASSPLPSPEDLIVGSMTVIGGVLFLFTVFILILIRS